MDDKNLDFILFRAQILSLNKDLSKETLNQIWNKFQPFFKENTLFYIIYNFCVRQEITEFNENIINQYYDFSNFFINFIINNLNLNISETQKLILINYYFFKSLKLSKNYSNLLKKDDLNEIIINLLQNTPEDNTSFFPVCNYEIKLELLSIFNSAGEITIKYAPEIIKLVPEIKNNKEKNELFLKNLKKVEQECMKNEMENNTI